jgi:hypothetical protein
MKDRIDTIPGNAYGAAEVGRSPISLAELKQLKVTAGMTLETEGHLRLAGEVLADQTQQIVDQWRSGIIASIPHLARHSRSLDGQPLPDYLARSNLRFRKWILDTCLRPYDQDWLDYQHEIALRHTRQRKNQVDSVESTAFVPFRDCCAFTAVMNETVKPYLAAKGHSQQQVEQMHQAWCKSIQLQLALWAKTYSIVPSRESQW